MGGHLSARGEKTGAWEAEANLHEGSFFLMRAADGDGLRGHSWTAQLDVWLLVVGLMGVMRGRSVWSF